MQAEQVLWRCTNTECKGDCTWCNRAAVENMTEAITLESLQRRCEAMRALNLTLAEENRTLKGRVAELERTLPN